MDQYSFQSLQLWTIIPNPLLFFYLSGQATENIMKAVVTFYNKRKLQRIILRAEESILQVFKIKVMHIIMRETKQRRNKKAHI